MNEAEKRKRESIGCSRCGASFLLKELIEKKCVQIIYTDKKGFRLSRPKLRACCPHCAGLWEFNLTPEQAGSIQRQIDLVIVSE